MQARFAYVLMFCLFGAGAALLSPRPSSAQSDEKSDLAQDFKAYNDRCEPTKSNPPTALSQSCANEKAGLVERQRKLNLTDADLDALLKYQGNKQMHGN
jgi:hypothetical protein